MATKYACLSLEHMHHIQVEVGDNVVRKEMALSWADGMIGVLPVFDCEKTAEKYADGKYIILEIETNE